MKKRVLLIGWDAADWKVINPLLDQGKMPNLEKLVRNGVTGNLASLRPELSPMLWTSIATGKRPFKHGILGFTEPDPEGKGIRPVSNLSRKTRAIWNILNLQGLRSVVVGWWPSYPVEPINGVMVSNHYQKAVGPREKPWPMQTGTVHPSRLHKNLKELRAHPQDLDPGLIGLFVPDFHKIDQEKDQRLEGIAKIIAEATSINNAATAIMHHEPWDLTAVYFDAIDHFCHGFMNFHPPRLPWIKEEDYLLFKNVVESGYRLHDIFLGTLLAEAGEDTTVIIVSDHGFHSDHLRPARIPDEPAGPAAQHRPYGIVLISGPDIKNDEIVYGASLLDICPTILNIFGLPIGDDMDGKPLSNIFKEQRQIETVESWDKVNGQDGSHLHNTVIDPLYSREAINQLVELGYIEKPDKNQEKAAQNAVKEIYYNLARSYMDAALHIKALPILEELYNDDPSEFRFGTELCHCYHATGAVLKARPVLEKIVKDKASAINEAEKKLTEITHELGGTIDIEKLDVKQKNEIKRLSRTLKSNPYAVNYLFGITALTEKNYAEAELFLKKAEKAGPSHPSLFTGLGQVYELMKSYESAMTNYESALKIDPENTEAITGKCRVELARKNNLEAAHLALDAIGLRYYNPDAHFLLGCALHRMGKISSAIEALEMAIRQNPNFPDACRRLVYIYKNRIKDAEKADYYKELAIKASKRIKEIKTGKFQENITEIRTRESSSITSDQIHAVIDIDEWPEINNTQDITLIVSGLPRSGTSMMMQMLEAGGMPLFTDGQREADEDNPKGYYENELVKRLSEDSSWFFKTRGKAVKIIAQLLHFIPVDDLTYCRVIFMERDYSEMINSQKRMLERNGKKGAGMPDSMLIQTFQKQTEKIKAMLKNRNVPAIYLSYAECLSDPEKSAKRINNLLGSTLDEKKMSATVDPLLYRQKS